MVVIFILFLLPFLVLLAQGQPADFAPIELGLRVQDDILSPLLDEDCLGNLSGEGAPKNLTGLRWKVGKITLYARNPINSWFHEVVYNNYVN